MRVNTVRTLAVAVGLTAAAAAAACAPPVPEVPPSPVPFTQHTVASLAGAAFVEAADVIGDGRPELVASGFVNSTGGPGRVTIHSMGATLDDWSQTDVVTPADGIRFPNDPTVADLDGDADSDVIVPGGFFICEFTLSPCGSLQWFEQSGAAWVRHQVVAPGSARFYHTARLADVDDDGVVDLVTASETASSAQAEWFRGTAGPDRFEPTPRVIGAGGGSLLQVADVDGDGDDDVVSPQLFGGTGFVWFERTADPAPATPAGTWVRHTITTATGDGFAVAPVANLFGDGVDRWVATNHVSDTRSGAYLLDPPAVPTDQWGLTRISTGIQTTVPAPGSYAPGVFGAGDIDGDGDTDLAVSGDGDTRLFWLQQNPDHTFTTFTLDSGMGQAGGALVVDLDGNGANEVVFSSFENDVLVAYERP